MQVRREQGFPQKGERALFWLGQAGFWFDTGDHRILIDPYLSDSLAKKYAGQVNDHQRMMPPPITPHELPEPDLVLVTHAHTDHMDPETLGPLATRFPDLPFVVPRAKLAVARERIGTDANLVSASDGQTLSPLPGLTLHVLPAAHETLDRDSEGNAHFLGYIIKAGGVTLYHSGDTIPFDGLSEAIGAIAPNVALLPVNGRDAVRLASGIPGNFTLEEAITLCQDASIPWLVPHHFGMFAFNTLSEEAIDAAAAKTSKPYITKAVVGERLLLDLA
ncbi:MAG: MBL fold metallo-hydrolase [Rhizobiales bacterium]|nr:MBL fold metallo-hydrolase [Hyphomicrobiales bacterium]MBO6699967.1 MBL fold metallo-hydrolase [Hyphomicrobiales bacterium]MBO6737868.1 MBL fold metallo-hydrolase [Hyphomicrobiales bacterium]MBO6913075.1 MBL fold metallo-hydrolase [Hyphomicrobiales bacterium]MBO6956663.1 MBL fold metallo-hydrolase [Hyphomicrobiales bacterium]